MKTKQLLLTFALLLTALPMLADNFSPTADYTVRLNGSKDAYSWFKNSDGEFELKQSANIFGLQTYTVTNLAAAKKITLVLKGESGKGTDASAIWVFTKNDWTTSTPASDMETAFSATTGVTHGSTGSTTSTYLMINTTSNRSTTDGVQTCNFEITGEKLAKLKSVASDNAFTLLITNAVSDVEGNTSTQRKYYSTSNATEANRPYVAVDYDPVVLETNSTISTYTTLNDAFNGIAAAGTGTITLYDDATITGRCDSGAKTISVVPVKDGITITSSLTNSLWFLTQTSGTVSIGSDSYQLTIDGQNNSNSSSFVEAGNNSVSTTFNNVKFKDCTTSASGTTSSIVCYKANGGVLNLKNVEFDGCSVTTSERGLIFCGLPNLNIQGGMTVTNCTSDYDIYIENNNTTDKFLKVKEMTEQPAQPIKVYCKTPALSTVVLSTSYTDMTSWFKVMNDNYGLAYKWTNGDNILTEAYTMTMNAYGASTLILPFDAKIPSGVTAYTLNYTAGNSYVKATEVEGGTLSANTPVLINGDASTKYWFINTSLVDETTTGSGTHTEGALIGVYAETTVPSGSYILWADATHDIGFYKGSSNKVNANRAYLTADGAGVKEALMIDFDGTTTGIESLTPNPSPVGEGSIFNLAGQRLSRMQKGINIVNGKKVLVR